MWHNLYVWITICTRIAIIGCRSIFRKVIVPKCFYSKKFYPEGSLLRRFWFQMVVIPKFGRMTLQDKKKKKKEKKNLRNNDSSGNNIFRITLTLNKNNFWIITLRNKTLNKNHSELWPYGISSCLRYRQIQNRTYWYNSVIYWNERWPSIRYMPTFQKNKQMFASFRCNFINRKVKAQIDRTVV